MDDTLPARTIVAQRFVIESRARGGGMGTVYRAIDTLTGRPVALKVMGGSAGAQDAPPSPWTGSKARTWRAACAVAVAEAMSRSRGGPRRAAVHYRRLPTQC